MGGKKENDGRNDNSKIKLKNRHLEFKKGSQLKEPGVNSKTDLQNFND